MLINHKIIDYRLIIRYFYIRYNILLIKNKITKSSVDIYFQY